MAPGFAVRQNRHCRVSPPNLSFNCAQDCCLRQDMPGLRCADLLNQVCCDMSDAWRAAQVLLI